MFPNSAKSTKHKDDGSNDNANHSSINTNYSDDNDNDNDNKVDIYSNSNVPPVKRNILPNGHLYVPVGKNRNRNGNMIKISVDVIQK